MARTVDEAAGFLPAAAFESYRVALGLSYSQASLVLALGAPGAIVGNIFPVLGDHYSRRVIAAGGAFGYAATLCAFAVGSSFGVLAGASFAMGFCATAVISGTELALVDVAGDAVTAYFARGVLFGTAGGLLGPTVLIAATATGSGWRGAFLVCAVMMAAYGTWLACLPLPRPRPSASTDRGRRPRHGLAPVLRDLRVWPPEPAIPLWDSHRERAANLDSGQRFRQGEDLHIRRSPIQPSLDRPRPLPRNQPVRMSAKLAAADW